MKFLDKNGLDFLWEKIKALVKQTSPQKLSQLQNDMGFLTGFIECDPTVPNWAKTPSKPSYTAYEVGALPYDTIIPSRTSELLNDSGFLTSHQSLSDYYNRSYIDAALLTKADVSSIPSLTGYATQQWVQSQGYLTSHQSLVDYYNKLEVDGLLSQKADISDIPSVDGFATQQWVNQQGFLKEHQSLDDYATQLWVNSQGFLKNFTETDPTVPSWAKQPSKPSYSAQEVGALPSSTVIPTKVSQLTNDSGYTNNTGTITGITMNGASKGTSGVVNLGTVLTEHQDISGKADKSDAIGTLTLSLDSTNYKVTLSGTKVDGTTFTVSDVIDLPLESVVVSGSYNDTTKKVVLTLQSGSTVEFSVADLVAGLQSEITSTNKLSADLIADGNTNKTVTQTEKTTWNNKGTYSKPSGGIPKTDLDSTVQTSLGKADTALQSFTETDPVFSASDAAGITSSDIENWDGKLDADAPSLLTGAIPFGRVDSTSTATKFTATVEGITEYRDGTTVLLKNGVVTSTTNFTININGLGAKKVYTNLAATTLESTKFNANYTMLFVYDTTRVDGGAWICYNGYDSNTNTIGYQLRTNSSVRTVTDTARYYKLYFTSANTLQWVPASVNSTNNVTTARTPNQRPIDPFGPIVYTSANTSYASGANLAATTIWQQYAFNLGYSFGPLATSMTSNKPVYLKCAPQSDGSAIIDSTTPIVQALPSTEDGKIYIFLGIAYNASNIELNLVHPVYYYKDNAIRLWTNQVASGGSITIDTDPTSGSSNAVSSGGVYTALAGKADTSSLATVATSGSYDDLDDKPTIPTVPTNVSAFNNDAGYLTSHQSLSGYATEQWVGQQGFLTSHQDISGKESTSNKVTSLSSSSTDTQYPSAKCVYDIVGDIQTALTAILS